MMNAHVGVIVDDFAAAGVFILSRQSSPALLRNLLSSSSALIRKSSLPAREICVFDIGVSFLCAENDIITRAVFNRMTVNLLEYRSEPAVSIDEMLS